MESFNRSTSDNHYTRDCRREKLSASDTSYPDSKRWCTILIVLSCDGVIKIYDSSGRLVGFDFVFNVPDHLQNPRSLREILLTPQRMAPLNERFTLASLLSRSVFFIHASHFVHKSIRPENIIVFQDASCQLGTPFLVGFNRFRMDTTISHRFEDDNWERNVYRHPQRQGIAPDEDFSMQHDIYSLGVVLLEIGLNTSFTWPKWRDDGCVEWLPNEEIGLMGTGKYDSLSVASSMKRKFVRMARDKLPSLMGHKYTQVVVSCLTCLDSGNDGFGDESEFEDEDGILVGVRFIEKVSLIQRRDPCDTDTKGLRSWLSFMISQCDASTRDSGLPLESASQAQGTNRSRVGLTTHLRISKYLCQIAHALVQTDESISKLKGPGIMPTYWHLLTSISLRQACTSLKPRKLDFFIKMC